MCVNEAGETIRLQRAEVRKVQDFKFLESTRLENGLCVKDLMKSVQVGQRKVQRRNRSICDV